MSRLAVVILLLLLPLAQTGACSQLEGQACVLDSDCEAGFVCSFEAVCTTFEAVAKAFDAAPEITHADTTDSTDTQGDIDIVDGTCDAPREVFESITTACAAPTQKLVATALVIDKDGNGMGPLAQVANSVLANGFRQGDIALELWVDGTFETGCSYTLAWVRGPEDINADCTPVFSQNMPFEIPGLVSTEIENAVIDPANGLITGLVDKPKLLLSIDEALRDVAESLIIEDVDTDNDQIPDRASIRMFVTF